MKKRLWAKVSHGGYHRVKKLMRFFVFIAFCMSVFNILTAVESQSEEFPTELDDIKIMFEGLRIFDLSGTNRIDVMFIEEIAQHGIFLNTNPVWAPNGQQIAYVNRQSNIFIVNADGSNPQQITQGGDGYSFPRWSQDDQSILFKGTKALHIIDVNARMEKTVAEQVFEPQWSPNNNYVIYFAYRDDRLRLVVVWINNQELIETAVLDISDANGAIGSSATWSPNGQQILFTNGTESHWDLIVTNLDGTSLKQLTDHKANDFCPSWSPDGQKIAFVSNREGVDALYLIDAGGSTPKKIADDITEKGCMATWSPNGEFIAFVGKRTINLLILSTGEVIPLSTYYNPRASNSKVRELRWHPNSQGILLDLNYTGVDKGADDPAFFMNFMSEFRWIDLACLNTDTGCTPKTIEETIVSSPIPESDDYSISPFINQ